MKTYLIPVLLVAFLLSSCSKKEKSLTQFHWMVGTWEKAPEDSVSKALEVWSIEDERLVGYGLTMEGSDTIFYEKLGIILDGGEIYYVADVGEGVVHFKLTEKEANRWVFTNPQHDFPKRIIYENDGKIMRAFTEAEEVSIPFEFVKR